MRVAEERFDVWKYLWTKRRGFLAFHAVVATVLASVLILNLLLGDSSSAHYRYIAIVLLLFQGTAFVLDVLWSVRDQRERQRRRREQAAQPRDREDDDFW
jgi:hypothetical protein